MHQRPILVTPRPFGRPGGGSRSEARPLNHPASTAWQNEFHPRLGGTMSTEGQDPNERNVGGDSEREPAVPKWWLILCLVTVMSVYVLLGTGLTWLLDLPEKVMLFVVPTLLLVLAMSLADAKTLRHVVIVAVVAAALGAFVIVACATAVFLSQNTIVYLVVAGISAVVAWLLVRPAYKRLGVPTRSLSRN